MIGFIFFAGYALGALTGYVVGRPKVQRTPDASDPLEVIPWHES